MVICYTPRSRLQPLEEVVAIVTWKKMWFPNTRTKKRCSSAAHSKTSRDIWIMSVWADELAAGTFVETQESVSSGLHMSAFPPLLIQTSFPRGTREEESYVQHNCYSLFYPCYDISIRQKLSQYERTLFDSRRQARDQTAAEASCIILASMWLTHLLSVCGPWCHSLFLRLLP